MATCELRIPDQISADALGVYDESRVEYTITGASDKETAIQLLLAKAPLTDGTNSLTRDTCDAVAVDEDPETWIGTVNYRRAAYYEEPEPAAGLTRYSFDISGKTERVTMSVSQDVNVRLGEQKPNFHGLIGVTRDGVNGAEVAVPQFEFTHTEYLPASTVDTVYQLGVASLVGRTNDAVFYGHAQGTVMFLGATGTRTGTLFEITFRFLVDRDRILLVDGITATVPAHSVVTPYTRDEVDATTFDLVKKIDAIIVDTVAVQDDFTALLITEPS
jgi:hypothetical protein